MCFGLGNFSTSKTARYQLAFIQLLIEKFEINSTIFTDPCFKDVEVKSLRYFNFEVDIKNLEGKQNILSTDWTTILFLPHCPTQLTNNILWKNWTPNLNRAVLIGNSIEYLITNQIESKFKRNGEYISRIKKAIEEFPIENNFHHVNSFNDTSIHIFIEDILDSYSIEFWKHAPEPEYDSKDLEIITANSDNKNLSS